MRPTLRFLDDDLISRIVGQARELLRTSGVAIRNPEAVALLTHRGVQVVEARFDQFSARCVAAYLRAKRSARL